MQSISLNRTWKLKIDPQNQGLIEKWQNNYEAIQSSAIDIEVPSCWEERVQDYEGVAWYALRTVVGTSNAGQICRLCFQASNYRTEVWVNGQFVGTHDGGYTPFDFEVHDCLHFGEENTFIIRVISAIVTKEIQIDTLGPNEMPHWRGGLTAGIWQSLSLEFNQSTWIESAFYQPQLQSSTFELALTMQSRQASEILVKITVCDISGEEVYSNQEAYSLLLGANTLQFSLPIKNPILWSCDNPHLYCANICLISNNTVLAEHTERIGMRSFTYENGRFYLNEEPIYLSGGFWEGVYAKHQSYPESREVVRKEIELAKAAGLNLLRPWRRPVPPIILEEADAAGLLIIASPAVECMSCWPALTAETPARIESEIRKLVTRDRNHACIIWWEMFNEVTREEIAQLIPKMSEIARSLDPTRLILDESGGWADGAHFYLPYSRERKSLSELHSYVRAPVSEKHWKLYQSLGSSDIKEGNTEIQAGAGLFVSEFGFGGLPEIQANCELFESHGNPLLPAYRQHHKIQKHLSDALRACTLQKIYPDVDSFCRASQIVQARGNRRQLEALLANENVSGYCIHAFTDGDWILGAGLIDHWQRPKAAYHSIAAANAHSGLFCFPQQRNIVHGEPVNCNLVWCDAHFLAPECIQISNDGAEHTISNISWSAATSFKRAQATIPSHLLQPGKNNIQVQCLDTTGETLSSIQVEVYSILEQPVQQKHRLVLYDPNTTIKKWFDEKGYKYIDLLEWESSDESIVLLFATEDVSSEDHLAQVAKALTQINANSGAAIFIEPPAKRESPFMLKEYEASMSIPVEKNKLLTSGTFPYRLTARPSFSFWESSMHVAKAHPVFNGLPQDCMMDEPYHEVAPAESFYQIDAQQAPAQTITWFRPEDKDKVKKRNYLGGEDLWYGTDIAIKNYGAGNIILSSLILRTKVGRDPVANCILSNYIKYAESLIDENKKQKQKKS